MGGRSQLDLPHIQAGSTFVPPPGICLPDLLAPSIERVSDVPDGIARHPGVPCVFRPSIQHLPDPAQDTVGRTQTTEPTWSSTPCTTSAG